MYHKRQTKAMLLAEKFRTELLTERLPKGSPVMSTRELAKHFSVSPVTADRILEILEEQDFIYRVPKSGTFVKYDPPLIPTIAYAGFLPDPVHSSDPIRNQAADRLMKRMTELGIEPLIMPYHTFRYPALAEHKLRKTNGLLIDAAFIDEITIKQLWEYQGKIVVIGNHYIVDQFPCSQIIPDYTAPLMEFDRIYHIARYSRILILAAMHNNARRSAISLVRILKGLKIPAEKIENILLNAPNSINAYLTACRYFKEHRISPGDTLILSLSEYFSQGIREAFAESAGMPDILNFDNLEDYQLDPGQKPYFTSVDRQMDLLCEKALDLLLDQLRHPESKQQVIYIPARLVLRQSVRKPSPRTR